MKSSFGRSFMAAALLLLFALTILGTAFQLLVRNYFTKSVMTGLRQDAQIIAELADVYGADGSLQSREFLLNLDITSRISESDVVICNSDGEVVMCSDGALGCEHLGLRINSAYMQKVVEAGYDEALGIISGLYDSRRFMVALPYSMDGEENAGLIIVSTPTSSTELVLDGISNLFLITAAVVVIFSVAAASAFARRESRPLRELADAANAFGHGDLEARVRLDDGYSVEVEDLALAFNNMASSLQKSEYRRQEFVANVSHELKTPMTTISGYVDGILDGTIPEEKHRHYLQIVSDETKRLSRLVRSMLDISQLQSSGIPDEKKVQFDLEECAGRVLLTFEKKINDKHLEVNVDMPEHPVYTFANQDYITQVIYNLLDNAVKFCSEGKELGLRIREAGNKAWVTVSNQGDTIPPEELPLVFDRFHKLDKSRSLNRDGWGLGLYIVKTIVCSHGEDISVTSRDGLTEFTFTMPLVN